MGDLIARLPFPFTVAQWSAFPLSLRVRWSRETGYGQRPASEELLANIATHVQRIEDRKAKHAAQ